MWGLASRNYGGSAGHALHACCPSMQLLAWAQNGMADSTLQLLSASAANLLPVAHIKKVGHACMHACRQLHADLFLFFPSFFQKGGMYRNAFTLLLFCLDCIFYQHLRLASKFG